jgi:biotin operon repressor
MKTMDIVIMPKGFYITTRYCGRAINREYFKTKTAMNARVKELKKEGYAIA